MCLCDMNFTFLGTIQFYSTKDSVLLVPIVCYSSLLSPVAISVERYRTENVPL